MIFIEEATTTAERTYSLIERNHHGEVLNTVAGLDKDFALAIAMTLVQSSAYTGDWPRTCEVVPELTAEEQAAALAHQWLHSRDADYVYPRSGLELSAIFGLLADRFRAMGNQQLSKIYMTMSLQVIAGGPEDERRATVDVLADALGVKAEAGDRSHMWRGQYLHIFTPVREAAGEPKPLPSDETVAQTEQIAEPYPDGAASVEPEQSDDGEAVSSQ